MSAESKAGQRGHAFLADWLVHRDLARAEAAFDDYHDHHEPKPGWYSYSSLNAMEDCPTAYYLNRVKGLSRVWPDKSPDEQAKALDREAKLASQVKDACIWMATEGLDGSDRLDTWGTEVYLETPEPFRFRMFLDQVAWDRTLDALVIRDHKFTWRNDLRITTRMLYGDQLLLYAATWNRMVERAEQWAGVPRIEHLVTNVIVVSAKGNHQVLPNESRLLLPELESRLWVRLWEAQERADAFRLQSEHNGWEFARRFMRPRSCVVFSACQFIPICHDMHEPDASSGLFKSDHDPEVEEEVDD